MKYVIDSKLESFLPVSQQSDFPIQNIPFGVGTWTSGKDVCLTRIGDTVINLSSLEENSFFKDCGLKENTFNQNTLNPFLSHDKATWRAVRNRIVEIFSKENKEFD